MSISRKLIYLTSSSLLGLLILMLWPSQNTLPTPSADLSMQKTTGEISQLKDFQGKSVLVNFWATSCIICLNEIDKMAAFYRQHGGDKFEILAVAMYHDRPDWVVQTMQDKNINYPVFFDINKNISRDFGNVIATPTSFIINPQGDVIYQHAGKTDFHRISDIINEQI